MLHDHCPLLAHVVVHALRHHELDNNSIGRGEIIWESFKLGALDAQRQVLKDQQMLFEDDLIREYSIKHNVNIRLFDLTFCSKPNVSSIRSSDVGTFIQIGGTVTRTGMIKMVESVRWYKCTSDRCCYEFREKADPDRGYVIEEPKNGCPQQGCDSKTIEMIDSRTVCRDCQELRLQEHSTKLAVGSIPRSILLIVEDDLVDNCKAGDDVMITGVVRRRWKPLMRDRKMELELSRAFFVFVSLVHLFLSSFYFVHLILSFLVDVLFFFLPVEF